MTHNLDQAQFCLAGIIQPTGLPLAPCVYPSSDLTDYTILPMGSASIPGASYLRVPPISRVIIYDQQGNETPIDGIQGTAIHPIIGSSAYTYRMMSQCTYMTDCYHHNNGMTPEVCQDYWTIEVPCDQPTSLFFPPRTNTAIFYFLGLAILMIVFIVIYCLMIIVAQREYWAQVERYEKCELNEDGEENGIYWGYG